MVDSANLIQNIKDIQIYDLTIYYLSREIFSNIQESRNLITLLLPVPGRRIILLYAVTLRTAECVTRIPEINYV